MKWSCALTGVRYGVIAAASGALSDFTVSGFTGDERRALLEWPDGPALFEHLRSLAGPLRVPDLAAHICALGFSAFPVPAGAFQATPMRHGEDYVWAGSSSAPARAGSPTPTRRRWCCSRSRRWRPSSTPARTAPSAGRGPTSRRWSRPAR